MVTRSGNVSTRDNVRPFSLEEQKIILTVGACLTCHEENDDVMTGSLYDFDGVLARKTEQCVLPSWE